MIKLKSYAKINLFLEVNFKLESGYHDITTLFSEINLHDIVKFSLTKNRKIILLSNIKFLANKFNLIYKIAVFIQDKYCVQSGALINLIKHIPISAGLGGGSSNAATAIKALSKLWKLDLSKEEMHEIASNFGSDINFFLEGYQAIGTNRGDIIHPINDDIFIDNILLVNPGFPISSAEAYQCTNGVPPFSVSPISDRHNINGETPFVQSINGETPFVPFNRLELGISKKYPIIQSSLDLLKANGASNAILSGSGATMIGFFDNPETLEKAQKIFTDMNFWSYKTTTRRRQKK